VGVGVLLIEKVNTNKRREKNRCGTREDIFTFEEGKSFI
jgi:hypothetical protein